MKQIEATKDRPFYSIGYVYSRNPWTCHSYNFWGMKLPIEKRFKGRTMQGTDSPEIAKEAAKQLFENQSISDVFIHVSTDCYNHPEFLHLKR